MTLGVVLLCPEWINKIGILSDRICLSFVLGGLSRDFRTHQHTNITPHIRKRIEDVRRLKSRIHRARELDGRLKTARKTTSQMRQYCTLLLQGTVEGELVGRLKTTRKKISRMGQCTVHSVSSSTGQRVNRNNITVGCGDFERPIECVVLNWEENNNEL